MPFIDHLLLRTEHSGGTEDTKGSQIRQHLYPNDAYRLVENMNTNQMIKQCKMTPVA